ncbi:MAG: LCP family protein [Spirochaetaceae bacterium]|nr:MAG: LCP family protein [Spirochaetaceae bacterium]
MVRRKRKWDKSILLLILIVLVVVAAGVFGYFQLRTDLFTEKLETGDPVAVLFCLAGDKDYGFFEILLYHPDTNRGAIIYIPGNVGMIIESLRKVDRIDVLYDRGNLSPLIDKIEELVALDIPFFIDLQDEELRNQVDLLGGLELFIPNPVDTAVAGKRVLLPSGSVVLDGDKIREFIAYQEEMENEVDSVGRKQRFLQTFLRSIADSDLVAEKNGFSVFRGNLNTNMSPRALSSFVAEMKKLNDEKIVFQRVLGSSRIVDQKQLLFPHFDGQLLKEIVKQTVETISSQEPFSEDELIVAIEVLNGTSVGGLARRAANVFQSFGYDVVSVANADNSDYQNTVVLDRKGRIDVAQRVADLIRCQRVYSRLEDEGDMTIDVTVILGTDFDGRYCKE